MTRINGTSLGAILVMAGLVGACSTPPDSTTAAPPPPEPEVAAASDASVAPLTDLAAEFDKLDSQQRTTNQQIADLLARYQKRGGTLPPGFGADLTDEQRAMLAERIKTEKAGLRTLLQDIIDRDKALTELRAQRTNVEGRLPEHVDAKEGDRHDRIAMNFLIAKGVSAAKAYEIVSQMNLEDALVPGFRVWTHYANGQFGTWVTTGVAGITPQQHRVRLTEMLRTERDEALSSLEKTRADLADVQAIARASEDARTTAESERDAVMKAAEEAQAENQRRAAAESTIRFVVGSKKELQNQKVIDGRFRLLAVDSPSAQPLNLTSTSDVSVDGSAHGMKRVKKVTLVPQVFTAGVDYQIALDGPFAQVKILQRDKFMINRFVAVVLE